MEAELLIFSKDQLPLNLAEVFNPIINGRISILPGQMQIILVMASF